MEKSNKSEIMAGSEPLPRPRKAARKQGGEKWHISFLPEDATQEAEFICSLPVSQDPELFIDRSDECAPGAYRIVKARANGQKMESYRYTKEELATTGAGEAPDDEPDDEADYNYGESYEPARAELPEDLDVRVARTVARVLDERDRRERAAQGQTSKVDELRQMIEMTNAARKEAFAEMKMFLPKENPAPPPQQNQFKEFMGMFKEVLQISEAVIPVRENQEKRGILGELADVAKEAVPYIVPQIAPMIGAALAKAQQKAATQQQQQSPQPLQAPQAAPTSSPQPPPPLQTPAPVGAPAAAVDEEPASFLSELQDVLESSLEDLHAGNTPVQSARDLVALMEDFPDESQDLQTLMRQPPGIVAETIATLAPPARAAVTSADGVAWIARLQVEIAARRPPLPPEPPPNGGSQVMAGD